MPFYHFTAAYKKATLRKVHSRKRIVSFSEKLEFFFRHQAFLQEYWVRIAYIFFQRRYSLLASLLSKALTLTCRNDTSGPR